MKKKKDYSDVSTVTQQKEKLIPEEFPEGPVGSPLGEEELVQGKSTPWKEGQYRTSAYVYADKEQHDDLPRKLDGAHPTHDEKKK